MHLWTTLSRIVKKNDGEVEGDINDNEENTPAQADFSPVVSWSGRIRQPPVRLTYEHMLTDDEELGVAEFMVYEPTTYDEVMNDDDYNKWQSAMMEER